MKLIKKFQHSGEITLENDAILVPPIRVKPITGYYLTPNSDLIHEVTVDPETGRFGIGVGYPKLTELLLKDKSAIERLYNRPYTNRLFLNLQRRIHNSNVRDIDSATKATGAIMTLASMLSGAARFGGNPGITSSGVKLIPALDPGNIAGYANALGYVTSDPFNWRTYTNPEVWGAALGMAGSAVDTSSGLVGMSPFRLEDKIQAGKVTLAELEQVLTKAQAKKLYEGIRGTKGMNTKEKQDLLKKAVAGTKGRKGTNRELTLTRELLNARNPSYMTAKIRGKYTDLIDEIKRTTGINWSDQAGVMASMPDDLKASKVGFNNESPFLERYYSNVLEVTKKGGLQDLLLTSGELRKNALGQWEGLIGGAYTRVDPVDYIKMRLANSKGYNFELAPKANIGSNYPMHGTTSQDYRYLTVPSSNPGKNGYFTVIQDENGIQSGLIEHYKGKGASVPFLRMPELEVPLMPHGNHNSNAYGEAGTSLIDLLRLNPGKVLMPKSVSDPSGPGMRVNEYNFGPNVENPKSLWNTLDFEPGAGPLSYNKDNNFSRNV